MANWFVRSSGGGGGGTTWTNSWNGLSGIAWGSVAAGDTIWLAGGAYSDTLSVGASGASGNVILVQRATAADPVATASPGWNVAFDSQVATTIAGGAAGIVFSSGSGNFVTIDGRTSRGIKITYADNTSGGSGIAITGSGASPFLNITLRWIYCLANGPFNEPVGIDIRGIAITPQQGITNLTIQHCETQFGDSGIYVTSGGPGATNILLEYNLFHDARNLSNNGQSAHPNGMFLGPWNGGTIRYNKLYGIDVEGLFFGFGPVNNVYIYGNLLFQGGTTPVNSGRGVTFDYGAGLVSNVFIYNNTFVDFPLEAIQFATPAQDGQTGTKTYSNCIALNNIFWNTSNDLQGGNGTSHNFNFDKGTTIAGEANGITNGSQPFVNYIQNSDSSDYHIVSTLGATFPRNNGTVITAVAGQTLNTDFDGVVRPSGGPWSMGAYEFVGGTSPITPGAHGSLSMTTVAAPRQTFRPLVTRF